MTDEDVIRFKVTVNQVRTLADGGLRYTFDAPESDIITATKLMQAKQAGAVLEIAAVAVKAESKSWRDRQS
jgi:hypothetical protein